MTGAIYTTASRLLEKHCRPPVRLIGVTCGKLTRERVVTMFPDEQQVKEERITTALDKLKDRFGEDVVKVASLLKRDK